MGPYRCRYTLDDLANAVISGGRSRQRNTGVGQEREHDQVVGALVPRAAHLVHAGQRQLADGAAGLLQGLPAGRVGKGLPELDPPAGKQPVTGERPAPLGNERHGTVGSRTIVRAAAVTLSYPLTGYPVPCAWTPQHWWRPVRWRGLPGLAAGRPVALAIARFTRW